MYLFIEYYYINNHSTSVLHGVTDSNINKIKYSPVKVAHR